MNFNAFLVNCVSVYGIDIKKAPNLFYGEISIELNY